MITELLKATSNKPKPYYELCELSWKKYKLLVKLN